MAGELDRFVVGEESIDSADGLNPEVLSKAVAFKRRLTERPLEAQPAYRSMVKTSNARMEGKPSTSDAIQWMGDRALRGATYGLYRNPLLSSTQKKKFAELDRSDVNLTLIPGVRGPTVKGRTFAEMSGSLLPIGGAASYFKSMFSRFKAGIQAGARAKVAPEVLKGERLAEAARRTTERSLLVRGVPSKETKSLADEAIARAVTAGPKQTSVQRAAEQVVKRTRISPKTLRPLTRKGKPIQTAVKVETKGVSAAATPPKKMTYGDLTEREIFGETMIGAPSEAAMAQRLSGSEALRRVSPAAVFGLRGRPAALLRPYGIIDPAVRYQLSRALPYVGGAFGATTGVMSPVMSLGRPIQPFNPEDEIDIELMKFLAGEE